MRFAKRLFFRLTLCAALLLLSASFAGSVFAAVDVSTSELQEASQIIFPAGEKLPLLKKYSSFSLDSVTLIEGGVSGNYEARLLSNPWLEVGIPRVNVEVYSYGSQGAAQQAFDTLSDDTNERWLVTTRGDDEIIIKHINGNLLFEAEYLDAPELDATLLIDLIEDMKLALGVLFPPTGTDLSTRSEKSSINLNELYILPQNGELNFNLYINELSGAVGTVLDSSGILKGSPGDMYLYIHSDGRLFAGIYAPHFDTECRQEAGWVRIETENPVHSFEWNAVKLSYGMGGFSLNLNGEKTVTCDVHQARSSNNLYFGDFPEDSLNQSMIGYIDDFSVTPSRDENGQTWDKVLADRIFIDVPADDPDVEIFSTLKDAGIFVGSEGYLFPERTLNRAEMLKVLLKAFGEKVGNESTDRFWDVPQGAWYMNYLAAAERIGMVTGHEDGRFLPGHQINRAELSTMIYRLAGEPDIAYDDEFIDVAEEDWFMKPALYAHKERLYFDEFLPAQPVTRRETAQILYELTLE